MPVSADSPHEFSGGLVVPVINLEQSTREAKMDNGRDKGEQEANAMVVGSPPGLVASERRSPPSLNVLSNQH